MPLFPSSSFSPGPPAAAAGCCLVLSLRFIFSHRPFLSACSANRPSLARLVRSPPRFWGVFQRGTNEGHSPRSLDGGGFPSHTCKPDSSDIFDMFPSALFFVYRNFTTLARIPTFSPIIMFYFACLMDSLWRSVGIKILRTCVVSVRPRQQSVETRKSCVHSASSISFVAFSRSDISQPKSTPTGPVTATRGARSPWL